jgi:WD40 repeat protein
VYCATRSTLISLSYDRSLAVWQIGAAGELTERSRTIAPAMIWSRAAAVLDAQRLVVGTFGSCYALYDWERGIWDLSGIEDSACVNAITRHQGDTYTVGDAGTVRRNGVPSAQLGSLCNFLIGVGERLYSGGQMGRIFDANTGKVLYEHYSPLNCAVLVPRQARQQLAVGTYTGEVLVFDVTADGRINLLQTMKVYDNAVKGLVVAGDTLFSVCASTDIAWHDCESLILRRKVRRAHERIANACCSAGEGAFASVSRDRTLRIWGKQADEVYPSPHFNSVKCVCASADGRTLLTGSYGGTLAMFDLPSRRWTRFLRPTTSGISCITYDAAAGQYLAAAYDGAVHVVHG